MQVLRSTELFGFIAVIQGWQTNDFGRDLTDRVLTVKFKVKQRGLKVGNVVHANKNDVFLM